MPDTTRTRPRWPVLLLPALLALTLTPPVAAVPLPGTPPPEDQRPSGAVEVRGQGPLASTRGQWPLPGPRVVRRTFEPAEPDWVSGHRGVDLQSRAGATVGAVASGRVGHVGRVGGVPVVVVDHGATRTTYQPVLPGVRRGTHVGAGDPLGTLSAAGSHCAPAACLHLGWRRGAAYLDPLLLLDAPRPVRLLP